MALCIVQVSSGGHAAEQVLPLLAERHGMELKDIQKDKFALRRIFEGTDAEGFKADIENLCGVTGVEIQPAP